MVGVASHRPTAFSIHPLGVMMVFMRCQVIVCATDSASDGHLSRCQYPYSDQPEAWSQRHTHHYLAEMSTTATQGDSEWSEDNRSMAAARRKETLAYAERSTS